MKDAAFEAYVEAIEAHLTALRGSPLTLLGPDFALAQAWHRSGVGLATVLAGIDRTAAERGTPATLASCRRCVDLIVESGAAPERRSQPAIPPDAPSDTARGERLRALAAALARLPDGAGQPLAARALALALVAHAVDDAALAALDADVSAAALRALPAALRLQLEQAAAAATARQRGRVSDAALAAARARLITSDARTHFGLPSVVD